MKQFINWIVRWNILLWLGLLCTGLFLGTMIGQATVRCVSNSGAQVDNAIFHADNKPKIIETVEAKEVTIAPSQMPKAVATSKEAEFTRQVSASTTAKAHATVIEADITAYSRSTECQKASCGTMASGKQAYLGAIACPRSMDFGVKVIIAGKTYRCEDRTDKKYDGRFDIFMGYGSTNYAKAWTWGNQTLDVTIL